jgi:adenylylsulfate kinase-like enzyme
MSGALGGRPFAVLVTGPVGAGKTSVVCAISALLDEAGVAHAAIDMDWLRWRHPSPDDDPFDAALGLRNLAHVAGEYMAAGVPRFILADVLESRQDVAGHRAALGGVEIAVVRLAAPVETLAARLEARESGASIEWYRRRAAELTAIMERERVEDLLVQTEERSVEVVAQEILRWLRWLP